MKQKGLIYLLVAEEAEMSLSDRFALLDGALLDQFGKDDNGYQRFYVQDAFLEYLIARSPDGKLYKITYTITGDDVTLGTAQEVETAYVPVSEAGTFVSEAGAATDDGVFPIQVIKAGWGRGSVSDSRGLPHFYTPEFVKIIAEACNGARFGRQHPKIEPPYEFGENDPKRIAGYLSEGRVVSEAAVSQVNLFKNETDLRGTLNSAREAGKLDLFGVSILANVGFKPGVREGKKCLEAVALGKLYSVDLCVEAGAGGQFLEPMRVAASANVSRDIAAAQSAAVKQGSSVEPNRHSRDSQGAGRKGNTMNRQQILRVIEALRSKDPAKAAQLLAELNAADDTALDAVFVKVTEAVAAPVLIDGKTPQQINAETKLLQFKNTMEAKLTDSKLPKPAQDTVRRHFEGRVDCTGEQVDAEIKAVREAVAAMDPTGRINGISLVTGMESADKLQLAFDRMLGVKEASKSGVPAFRGIREAYVTVTGDHDLSKLRGSSAAFWLRASEAIAATDFPNLLLNSQTKRLLQDYAELAIDGLDMLYTPATIADYKLQDRVRDGYFGELPVVAEAAPYLEIVKPTDERVNYAVANYGGLLTISEQTIRNDDLGAIAKFPARLARAGRQTLRTYITNFFAANPNYMADAVTWFNAGHNNLGTAALSQDSLIAAEQLLMKQTEKDSGERLGLPLDWIMVPIELKATAIQINQTNTAGNNAFFQRFGANNERIIVNAKMTDANDWCYGTSSDNAPFLEIGFLDGIKQPQIFLANLPTQGTAFLNDQIQYKVKFPFGGAIIDYRGVGKNVVAG